MLENGEELIKADEIVRRKMAGAIRYRTYQLAGSNVTGMVEITLQRVRDLSQVAIKHKQ